MSMNWIAEPAARWDTGKDRIVGGAPDGVFDFGDLVEGALVPGEWWRIDMDGHTVGYAWMDVTWGYAPVLVAVDASARRHGVGRFAMDQLVAEAAKRGLHYLFNVIPAAHPDPDGLRAWLLRCGFEASEADERMLRRKVN